MKMKFNRIVLTFYIFINLEIALISTRSVLLAVDTEYTFHFTKNWSQIKSAFGLMDVMIHESSCTETSYSLISYICSDSYKLAAVVAMTCDAKFHEVVNFTGKASIPILRVPFGYESKFDSSTSSYKVYKKSKVFAFTTNWSEALNQLLIQLEAHGVVFVYNESILPSRVLSDLTNKFLSRVNASLAYNFDGIDQPIAIEYARFVVKRINTLRSLYSTVVLVLSSGQIVQFMDVASDSGFNLEGIKWVLANPYLTSDDLVRTGIDRDLFQATKLMIFRFFSKQKSSMCQNMSTLALKFHVF